MAHPTHMTLFLSVDDGGVSFHYYTRDYLGNNRAVVNGTSGEIEQTVAYYPYGGVIADLGTGSGVQPYKFGAKELISANGLNEYDFGARRYWQSVPMFTSIDPESEKLYWLSPYLYCANNPVNLVDLNGEKPSPYEAALMCGYVYHDENFEYYSKKLESTKWELSHKMISITMSNTGKYENGLQSELFERTIDGVTEYAYAFAGSDSPRDWFENIAQLFGKSSQYSDAIHNARILDEEIGDDELTFVGQSLGGGLGAASSMATGRAAITFNRASVSWRTSLCHRLGSVDNVTDYVLVKKSGLPGIYFYEPVTAVQRLFKIQAKGHQIIVPVENVGYIDSHKIKSVVDNIQKLKGK